MASAPPAASSDNVLALSVGAGHGQQPLVESQQRLFELPLSRIRFLRTPDLQVSAPTSFKIQGNAVRTYADFEWLRAQLVLECGGGIVPRVPSRSTSDVGARFGGPAAEALVPHDELGADLSAWLVELATSEHIASSRTLALFVDATHGMRTVKVLGGGAATASPQQAESSKQSLLDTCRVFIWRVRQRVPFAAHRGVAADVPKVELALSAAIAAHVDRAERHARGAARLLALASEAHAQRTALCGTQRRARDEALALAAGAGGDAVTASVKTTSEAFASRELTLADGAAPLLDSTRHAARALRQLVCSARGYVDAARSALRMRDLCDALHASVASSTVTLSAAAEKKRTAMLSRLLNALATLAAHCSQLERSYATYSARREALLLVALSTWDVAQ